MSPHLTLSLRSSIPSTLLLVLCAGCTGGGGPGGLGGGTEQQQQDYIVWCGSSNKEVVKDADNDDLRFLSGSGNLVYDQTTIDNAYVSCARFYINSTWVGSVVYARAVDNSTATALVDSKGNLIDVERSGSEYKVIYTNRRVAAASSPCNSHVQTDHPAGEQGQARLIDGEWAYPPHGEAAVGTLAGELEEDQDAADWPQEDWLAAFAAAASGSPYLPLLTRSER
jgi:hypothetical protein